MATIKNGVMGGFSGKVGTVVGGNWNGIDYMRGKTPPHKDPQTAAQLDQRARFKLILKFLKPFKPFFHIGFKQRKPGTSAYNAALSCNFKEAIVGVTPDYKIDFTKLIVSMGPLPGALNPVVAARVAGQIDYSWQNNSGRENAHANDRAILVAYNQEKGKVITSMSTHLRINESEALAMPADFAGDTIHCYISFRMANETSVSNSKYVGAITML